MKNKLLFCGIGLLSSCLTSSAYADEPLSRDELTIWVSEHKGYTGMVKVAAKFEHDTGYRINVEHFDSLPAKFQERASCGGGPDILVWAHDRYGEWAKLGLLEEIKPTKEELEKFYDISWDAMKINGKYYGYPFAVEAVSLICNRDLVPNPPKTFEEFMTLDAEMQEKGKHAFLWDYNNVYYSYPILSANGGYSYKRNEDGSYDIQNIGVSNEGTQKGLNYIVKMVQGGHLPIQTEYKSMEAEFIAGKIGCIINGPWGWKNYKNMNYSVNTFPTLEGKQGKPFVGVLGLVINKSSSHKEAARKFLTEYLLTDYGYEEVNNASQLGSVALKSFETKLESDPRIMTTMKNAQSGVIMPNVPEMNIFWSSVREAIKRATSGRQTADKALKTAESRIRKVK
ncbi:MAG: maltose/maltodextrin ABC transporter substrate-binding protein MalE [Ruminobacter sp.]|uniref:maltose/maltodextrin ABC transporter substrate-binding protein MalE n=1 Tax=Ruminobacter sp. TaxID=2774296 RepID=UPI00257F7E85|nr:maltose/maltodextrin ABC transporter substrate-binding protein MalE [Ruminobacter sp.]MBQ3776346.1 maltose/maltodextrin ABC transporter substrate-binding protein MalE [Ruminobacter sp.]